MVEVIKYDKTGNESGKAQLSAEVFDVAVNEEVVKDYLILQLANRRRALAKTKTRSEVRGGGRKPWKQKGTGRARIGTLSSPILVGGGVAHGPKGNSNFKKSMPKKMRRLALRSILTDKVRGGGIAVIEDMEFSAPKTKEALKIVNNIGNQKILFIAPEREEQSYEMDARDRKARTNMELSMRNLPNVKTLIWKNLNPHDILNFPKVIILESALEKIEKMLTN